VQFFGLQQRRVAMFCCNVAGEFEWFQANDSKRPTRLKPLWLLGFVYFSKPERRRAKNLGGNQKSDALSN
jgi:hypothetical protein